MFNINIKTVIAIAAAAGATVFVVKKFFSKKVTNRTGIVKEKSWVETTHVEKFDEVTESGWTVPDGAYDVTSERRLKKAICPSSFGSASDVVNDVMRATYQTYYTYKVKRWVDDGNVVRRGTGDYTTDENAVENLCENFAEVTVGQRRISGVNRKFNILVVDDETGEFVSVQTEEEYYECIDVGKRVSYYSNPFVKRLLGVVVESDDGGFLTDEDAENI